MARDSKTETSLLSIATLLLRHCHSHRLMPVAEELLDRGLVLNAVRDAVDLFEERIEAMPPRAARR